MTMLPALLVMMSLQAPLHVVEGNVATASLAADEAQTWVELFVAEVARHGVKVTTRRDVAMLLGIERQRQLLGCPESGASCLAEIAGATNADAVLVTSVADASGRVAWVTRAVDQGGATVASVQVVRPSRGELLDALPSAARTLVAGLRAWRPERFSAPAPGEAEAAVEPPPPAHRLRWLGGAIPAVVGLGAGLGLRFAAESIAAGLSAGTAPYTTARSRCSRPWRVVGPSRWGAGSASASRSRAR